MVRILMNVRFGSKADVHYLLINLVVVYRLILLLFFTSFMSCRGVKLQ